MSEDVFIDDAVDPVVAIVAVIENWSIVAIVDKASYRLYLSEDVVSILVDEVAAAAGYHVDENLGDIVIDDDLVADVVVQSMKRIVGAVKWSWSRSRCQCRAWRRCRYAGMGDTNRS
uniref:Uncharacterized protein n=1 Tax=Leersia perrieri TaxID=77586 RepID=A0A0D9VWN6_9ORYZ